MRKILIGVTAAGLLAIGAVFVYLNVTAVDVVVTNSNCEPFSLRADLPLGLAQLVRLLGVKLPSGEIPPGGQATAQAPAVTIDVDASTPGAVAITVLGRTVEAGVPDDLESVTFDGKPLLNQRTSLDLGDRSSHNVVVTCR